MTKTYLAGALALLTLACSPPIVSGTSGQSTADSAYTFANPLLPGGPDPWVFQKDGFYYYTNTSGNRIRLWRTRAMSQLNNAPDKVVWTKPSEGPNAHNIWAPEIHYLDGKWYIYYTAGASPDHATQRTFVLENAAQNPLEGTWVDRGKLADPAADFFAIDATVLEHNGKKYLIWSGHESATEKTQRLYIAEMKSPYQLATPRSLISSPTYAWEKSGAPPAVNEGPEILRGPTGKLFLVFSASGCWTDDYALGIMTLKDGGDPMKAEDWIKSPEPVFVKKPEHGAYGPGHNGFFKSADGKEDWIIYHANPQPDQKCNNSRSPRMQPFTWNGDGTPNFGEPVNINARLKLPSGETP